MKILIYYSPPLQSLASNAHVILSLPEHTDTHSHTTPYFISLGTFPEEAKLRDVSSDHIDPQGKVHSKYQKDKEPVDDIANLMMTESLWATTPKHTDICHHNLGNSLWN
jgi:hypothetical protein